MFNDRFCAECLSGEEAAFLREHVVPTYPYGTCCHLWDDARSHKEHYVLKHARLGKSEKVYAGRLCSDRLWSELFERPELHDMVLQPFVEQRRWRVRWRGREVLEYVCGTILCLDDEYYGTGIFRASSCPIINLVDDSKIGGLVTGQGDRLVLPYAL